MTSAVAPTAAVTGTPRTTARRTLRALLFLGGLLAAAWLVQVLAAGHARADDAPRNPLGGVTAAVGHVVHTVLPPAAPAHPAPEQHHASPTSHTTPKPAPVPAVVTQVVAPVVDQVVVPVVKPVVAAVAPVVKPVVAAVAPVVKPVVVAVAPVVKPVVVAVAPVVKPVVHTVAPVVAPVVHTVAPVVHTVAPVVAPVGHVAAPVLPVAVVPVVTGTHPTGNVTHPAASGSPTSTAVATTPAAAADPTSATRVAEPVATGTSTGRRSTPVTASGAAGDHAPDVVTGEASNRAARPALPTSPVPTSPVPAAPAPSSPAPGAGGTAAPHGELGLLATATARTATPLSVLGAHAGDELPLERHLTDLADRPD